MAEKSKSADNQHAAFIEAARELECDEDEAAFKERLRHLAKHKPVPKGKAKSRKPKG